MMSIATKYDVCQPTISKIAKGVQWSHLAVDRKAG